MSSPLLVLITDRIRAVGPITVAEYVELALYHPEHGYYTTAARRSGRQGDFYTSVDLGPLFGELLAVQVAEMLAVLAEPPFDLVEAAAGNGRLSRHLLDALERLAPDLYAASRIHLIERSASARAEHRATLGHHAARLVTSGPAFPEGGVRGVLLANELLDALPPHLVVMRDDGLREVYVTSRGRETLTTVEGALSSPRLHAYLGRVGAQLQPGWRAEVNLAAEDWVRRAGRALDRGFLLLLDYGHEAAELYSEHHPGGTLTTFQRHVSEDGAESRAWLGDPGGRDITSHVDLTGVRLAARAAGLDTLGVVDQGYFLLALAENARPGFEQEGPAALRRRLALKTLVLPGGMGSTHKALVFARGVGRPRLKGLKHGGRLT
jgi:SAM-dependent MidA family methyltransferase